MKSALSSFVLMLLFLNVPKSVFTQEPTNEFKPSYVSVSFNGTFVINSPSKSSRANSENSNFWCQYDIGRVGDEVQEMKNFKLFEDNQLSYILEQAPGSDLYISNSGICAFMDLTHHYKAELTIHFYSKTGHHLFSETVKGASLFGFSAIGNKFGVGNANYLKIISIPNH